MVTDYRAALDFHRSPSPMRSTRCPSVCSMPGIENTRRHPTHPTRRRAASFPPGGPRLLHLPQEVQCRPRDERIGWRFEYMSSPSHEPYMIIVALRATQIITCAFATIAFPLGYLYTDGSSFGCDRKATMASASAKAAQQSTNAETQTILPTKDLFRLDGRTILSQLHHLQVLGIRSIVASV